MLFVPRLPSIVTCFYCVFLLLSCFFRASFVFFHPQTSSRDTAIFVGSVHSVALALSPATGHLVSSVLVHMLCNFMGVPDITFIIPPGNGESTRTSVLHEHRIGEAR